MDTLKDFQELIQPLSSMPFLSNTFQAWNVETSRSFEELGMLTFKQIKTKHKKRSPAF